MSTKQAVIATLAYFDIFGIPLTRDEISEHLFIMPPDERQIDIYLKESPLITVHDGFYSLQGDEKFFLNFYDKITRSKKYWKRVKKFQWLFSICPFVELVCVCNSLPINDTNYNSDIDLFIVTKKGKLFIARAFFTFLTHIFRVRRHGAKIEKRFCLSFYICESNLNLENLTLKPFDIYLAYWLKTMQPISGDFEIYEELININSNWIKKYFPHNLPKNKRYFRPRTEKQIKWKEKIEKFLNKEKYEKKMMAWQLSRAKQKSDNLTNKSGTIIQENILKFHNKDIREEVKNTWKKRITEFF